MRKNKLRTSLTGPVRKPHKKLMNFSNGAGFTLIEGLVILSILVILVMAALLAYRPMRGKAYETQEKAIIASLETAINTYYAKYLRWYADAGSSSQESPFDLLGAAAPSHNRCSIPYREPCPEAGKWTLDVGICDNQCTRWVIRCPHYDWSSPPDTGNEWVYMPVPDTGNVRLCERGAKPGEFVKCIASGH